MTYRIDSSVPVPEFRGSSWRTVYPFGRMLVGDSILVEPGKAVTAAASARQFARRHAGWKFTSLREAGGMRIWCVRVPQKLDELPLRVVNRLGDW